VPNSGRFGSANIAVITVLDEEMDAASRVLGTAANVPNTPCYVVAIAEPPNYEFVLRRTLDRGNHPAREAVTDLIEWFRPDHFLLVGIAGGIEGRDGTQKGDVIIADAIEYYESRKLVAGQNLRRATPCAQPSPNLLQNIVEPVRRDGRWREHITVERPVAGQPEARVGNIISGDKLLGDSSNEFQVTILGEYDKALAVEMEAFGVAREIYRVETLPDYNPQYLVIRGISDLANAAEDNNEARHAWKNYAADVAASFACGVIDRMAVR
jgi:nucleoside phosphorylase